MIEAKPHSEKMTARTSVGLKHGERRLFSISEAAAHIHPDIKEATVRRLIRNHEIRAVKISRSYYVPVDELERYLTCLEKGNPQDSIKDETTAHGSYLMAENKSGPDMVRAFLEKQKKH
ncbi:helix-turn-helix domain-containing protein [Rhodobacterales bacterium HKCCSP123]|nr:helix-turn-helix domain-containing protein [Rhodobacterales bacterium HKCCSP123]